MPYPDATYPQPSTDRNPVGTHTEGPWSIGPVQWLTHQPTGCGYAYRPIVAGTWEVAQVWEDEFDGEMTANVHLVAAAPAMKAALESIRSQLMELDDDGCGHPGMGWRNMDATLVDSLLSNSLRQAIDAIQMAEGRE